MTSRRVKSRDVKRGRMLEAKAEADAKHLRPRSRPRPKDPDAEAEATGYEAEPEAEAKILASSPIWPRGFNISGEKCVIANRKSPSTRPAVCRQSSACCRVI